VDGIYIAGGNVNSIYFDSTYDHYLAELKTNKAKIVLMRDGLCATDLQSSPQYRRVVPDEEKGLVLDPHPIDATPEEKDDGRQVRFATAATVVLLFCSFSVFFCPLLSSSYLSLSSVVVFCTLLFLTPHSSSSKL
jgi:hypothetical protein